jgi:hypothetical protein
LVKVDCVDLTECESLDDLEKALGHMGSSYVTVWLKKEDVEDMARE